MPTSNLCSRITFTAASSSFSSYEWEGWWIPVCVCVFVCVCVLTVPVRSASIYSVWLAQMNIGLLCEHKCWHYSFWSCVWSCKALIVSPVALNCTLSSAIIQYFFGTLPCCTWAASKVQVHKSDLIQESYSLTFKDWSCLQCCLNSQEAGTKKCYVLFYFWHWTFLVPVKMSSFLKTCSMAIYVSDFRGRNGPLTFHSTTQSCYSKPFT